MNFFKYYTKEKGGIKMENNDYNFANLTSEQQRKISQMESELGCVLVAYENKSLHPNQFSSKTIRL
jgi:hypothetical protein